MSQQFLISRLSALGDVVCSLPVAVALKDSFLDCQITWAVDQRFAGVVECCTSVDQIIRVNRKGASPELDALRGREFDAAFDIQGLLKSASILARVRAKLKLGYHWQREGASLFSRKVMPDPTSLHVVDQYVDVARAAGAEMDGARFNLSPMPEDITKIESLLEASGVSLEKGPLVLLNAGAGWASKRWPAASFAFLQDELRAQGAQPVFLGAGKADEATYREVAVASQATPISLIGQTNVSGLIALISKASAHIGGDTGSSHVAAALGIPAIGIYSRTRPERSCPYGQIQRCLFDPDSMANISPQSVLLAVSEALR